MTKPLKILKDYDKIKYVLRRQSFVKDFIPMTRGGVSILGGQEMSFMLTFGCNFDDFQRVFGNPVKPVEGHLLQGAEHGLMVNIEGRKNLQKSQGYWLVPRGPSWTRQTSATTRRKSPSWRRAAPWRWKGSGRSTPRTRKYPSSASRASSP